MSADVAKSQEEGLLLLSPCELNEARLKLFCNDYYFLSNKGVLSNEVQTTASQALQNNMFAIL